MEKTLSGKTAIVTNADAGIGQAVAIEFARQGADVVINYLYDEDGAQQTFHQVQRQGQKALVVQANMMDERQVESMFESVVQIFGDIYALVNNAGLDTATAESPAPPLPDAYTYSTSYFIDHRRRAGGKGKLIQIIPAHPRIALHTTDGLPESGGEAVKSFSRRLALEVAAQKINVNNLAIGLVQPSGEQTGSQQLQEQDIPLKRFAKPQEVAKLALFMASEAADYCTGTTFTMDGGLSLLNQN
ncbi:SDR family oxidoreductase [Pontibacter sp. CAU 1760]